MSIPALPEPRPRPDFHTALRSGTDIAFLGGMIKYILENDKYFKDYVVNYTNATFLVNEKFDFNDGLFSGYDPTDQQIRQSSSWTIKSDGQGMPVKDPTLAGPPDASSSS